MIQVLIKIYIITKRHDLILLDYFNRNKSKLKYKNTTDFVKLKRLREKSISKKLIKLKSHQIF